jgi:hypothetical protein
MSDTTERLKPYQTDNLILLVGTNPLPNYVAARLLLKPHGKIHLIYSSGTESIAGRLEQQFARDGLQCERRPVVRESKPRDIYDAIHTIVPNMLGSVGLHYTGGTKAMSVHAYRAVKDAPEGAWCSYLDAHDLKMVIDGGMGDGRDAEIPVGDAVTPKIQQVIELHEITLAKPPKQKPILPEVAKAIKTIMDRDNEWRGWTQINLRRPDNKTKFVGEGQLKKLAVPSSIPAFADICSAFANLGATDTSLEAWARASGEFEPRKDMEDFAKWLEGEWLESFVLDCLLQIAAECRLHDCGMDYQSDTGKFQFDVAAMRGYQLFAISCTTSNNKDLCKHKLFEAYVRAKQMGGDEARVALVSYHKDPQTLLTNFLNEWKYSKASVHVFGKDDLTDLHNNLRDWIESN